MNVPFSLLLLALSATLPAAGALAAGALAAEAWPTPNPDNAEVTELGRYRISYASALEPIEINRIHIWVAQVMDADGNPVEGATISISGGMPDHDHGLPTAPRATAYLGEGRYLIEGMKFHMGGAWEVVINVKSGTGDDALSIPLDL